MCAHVGLAFDPAMLSWPAGPKPEDGSWAPHWYHSVHRSTGFAPYAPAARPVPEHLHGVLAEAMPLYERLADHAVAAS